MRWSRPHTDASLGELMDAGPEAEDTAEDTAVRPAVATAERPTIASEAVEPDANDPDADDPGANDSFLDDEDYLPQERRGPGRLTIALVAALVLAVGVLGGVWVQKQLGTSATPAGFGARQGAAGGAAAGGAAGGTGQRGYGGTGAGTGAGTGGTAQGGTAQGGAAQDGAAQDGAAQGGDAPAGTGGGTTGGAGTAATPAVVGTVTSAGKKSLVVTDLGGTKHTVTLTDATTVTTAYAHGALKTGDTVAVAGKAAADGSVSATGITVT